MPSRASSTRNSLKRARRSAATAAAWAGDDVPRCLTRRSTAVVPLDEGVNSASVAAIINELAITPACLSGGSDTGSMRPSRSRTTAEPRVGDRQAMAFTRRPEISSRTLAGSACISASRAGRSARFEAYIAHALRSGYI